MIYTLTVSSQGQIVIPSQVRKKLGIKSGDTLIASVTSSVGGPEIRLKPGSADWVRRLAGSATGVYGDVKDYVAQERRTWDNDTST